MTSTPKQQWKLARFFLCHVPVPLQLAPWAFDDLPREWRDFLNEYEAECCCRGYEGLSVADRIAEGQSPSEIAKVIEGFRRNVEENYAKLFPPKRRLRRSPPAIAAQGQAAARRARVRALRIRAALRYR